MPNSKSTRSDLESKLVRVVEAEQEGLDVLERFERADRLKSTPAGRNPSDILAGVRNRGAS